MRVHATFWWSMHRISVRFGKLSNLVAAQVWQPRVTRKEQRQAGRLDEITSKLSSRLHPKLARRIGQLERQTGVPIINYDLYAFLE